MSEPVKRTVKRKSKPVALSDLRGLRHHRMSPNGPVPDAVVKRGDDFEERIAKKIQEIDVLEEARLRRSARDVVRLDLPPVGLSLADAMAAALEHTEYSIDELHPAGGNSLLVASYKTGKTVLTINLVKAKADGTPFLGRFKVRPLEGRVAFLNYEMHRDQFLSWCRDVGFEHPERVAPPLHLRGVGLPFWVPEIEEQVVEWLRGNEVEFLIADPAAEMWQGLVENENDNSQVARFGRAVDRLKHLAGVQDFILATHMGREQFAEGAERSRAATRLQDWADASWYLTKDASERRSLRAEGRDVMVPALDLAWDAATRTVTVSGLTRAERRSEEGLERVADALIEVGEGSVTGKVEEAIKGDKTSRSGWVAAAAREGIVVRRHKDGTEHVEGGDCCANTAPKLCYFTDYGRERYVLRKVSKP